ncbi:MAG TPA: deoxynucleoside kinase [Candidatus Dependentiae bacterium]|nr:deoxynucleoside kinase [Candidatus Dependentiae bacterium]
MYILEGNIGAGKSTFLKLIEQHIPYISIGFEPLNNWHTEKSGQSLLQQFYEQPKRWAYTLETLALMSRVKEHMLEQKHTHDFRLVERSIYSGFYCFAKNSFQSGFLTDIEWSIYKEWFSFLTHNNCNVPDGFIYLKVDPEIAFERTKIRNRSAESSMTLSYLKDIDKLHSDFLLEKKGIDEKLKDVPVLVLDCNTDFEHNEKQFEQHCQKLSSFLQETKLNCSRANNTACRL